MVWLPPEGQSTAFQNPRSISLLLKIAFITLAYCKNLTSLTE